jgi:hypothetical protein
VKPTIEDLSLEFQNDISELRTAPQKHVAWRNIIDKYGSHYLTTFELGGSISKQVVSGRETDAGTKRTAGDINSRMNTGILLASIGFNPRHSSSISQTNEQDQTLIEFKGLSGEPNDRIEWQKGAESRECYIRAPNINSETIRLFLDDHQVYRMETPLHSRLERDKGARPSHGTTWNATSIDN